MLAFLARTRNVLLRQRDQHLLRQSLTRHKNKGLLPSGKIIESYLAPPSFLLMVWASFPLLLIVTLKPDTIAMSIFATFINFVMIHHLDTFRSVLYLLCGLVLLLVTSLYHFGYV